jgi:NADH:ubiquinone reductase (non-electrogenic)
MRTALRIEVSPIGIHAAARRPFMTSSFARAARPSSRNLLPKSNLQQSFRRTYADIQSAKPMEPTTPVKKPRRFRALRLIWRATYLSILGGAGYVAYSIYELRHPEEQFEPDPTKQNLVILGENAKPSRV